MSNRFYDSMANVLEVPTVEPDTKFRELPGWCSLHGFGLLVMMENDWQAPIAIGSFLTMTTARDLYAEAFIAFAARLLKVPRESLTPASAYGSIPEWDSVNHLRLVMEAEKFFGTRYELERIPAMKTIADFL